MKQKISIVRIAKESGVSTATVSRVMNGSAAVSEETKKKVLKTIEKYDYVPNAFSRKLIRRQSMTIGIIMPDITNPYFTSMFAEFESAAYEVGYSVFLCNSSFSASRQKDMTQREIEYFQMMLDRCVDGVLIVGGQADLYRPNEDYRQALKKLCSVIPTVVIGNKIDGIPYRSIPRENDKGVFSSVSYLAALGHKKIAFVGGEPGVIITEERLGTYMQALEILHLPKSMDLVSTSDYYARSGFDAMETLLKRKTGFTAFLAMNDNVALGAIRSLTDHGLRIPRDVSCISCDQFLTSDFFCPRLTAVNQHNEQFARFVINILLGAIQDLDDAIPISFHQELIIRESCAEPPSHVLT